MNNVTRVTIATIATGVMAAGAAGCGHHVKPQISASASAVASADVAKEQKLVDQCLAKGTILTKAGRKAFFECAAGGMTPASFEACATKQLKASSLLTRKGRHNWLLEVGEKCVATS